ncbi:hypothetical protein [Methanococcus voltae]|uniref:Uncharacterized protein with gpF-like domain n=1 Tax=Methanococcus voltae TaxID=2188 RepID=A0A8J7UV12_METVO|nr:hypothetical protein [Methanococcus voltae]MBP2173028.1 uncharacterized protein with gpF-like domain [Methanococcus voltae]MBP2201916.1 uncharacterized protein with gpF-like domain [Methanococcus voltae]
MRLNGIQIKGTSKTSNDTIVNNNTNISNKNTKNTKNSIKSKNNEKYDKDSIILNGNHTIDISKDVAVNMALKQLYSQVFTTYTVTSSFKLSDKEISNISNIIDSKKDELKKALSDYLLRGKCILYRLNRIDPQGIELRINNDINPSNYDKSDKIKLINQFKYLNKQEEYFIKYSATKAQGNWWDGDLSDVNVVIAPKYVWNQVEADEYYSDIYLSVFNNPIPIHDTIQELSNHKYSLGCSIMPKMAEKSVVPTIIAVSDDVNALKTAKLGLSNYQNGTRIIIPCSPEKFHSETISIGKDIPVDLLSLMLDHYESGIFMGLGTSISIIKASGQELTTSRTIYKNLMGIIRGYQDDVERWINDQLTKMGYPDIWIKFANPDPEFESEIIEKAKEVAELKKSESETGHDYSTLVERIFPSNEYGEMMASYEKSNSNYYTIEEIDSILNDLRAMDEGKTKNEAGKKSEDVNYPNCKKIDLEQNLNDSVTKRDKYFELVDEFKLISQNLSKSYGQDNFGQIFDNLFLEYLIPKLNSLNLFETLDYYTLEKINKTFKKEMEIYLKDSNGKKIKNIQELSKDTEITILQNIVFRNILRAYNIAMIKKYWKKRIMIVSKDEHFKLNGLSFLPFEYPELLPPYDLNCECGIIYFGD